MYVRERGMPCPRHLLCECVVPVLVVSYLPRQLTHLPQQLQANSTFTTTTPTYYQQQQYQSYMLA
jgi:hypothetical protein